MGINELNKISASILVMQRHVELIKKVRKRIPKKAIFAFNTNVDAVRHLSKREIAGLRPPKKLIPIFSAIRKNEQKEVVVDRKTISWLIKNFGADCFLVGGQAGNAAHTASLLGVRCFLHSNYKSRSLLSLFRKPENVLIAHGGLFREADRISENGEYGVHFIIECERERYIASYDPKKPVVDAEFGKAIGKEIKSINKAFVGGFHLFEEPSHVIEAANEIRRWKKLNPSLRIHLEMGESQRKDVLSATKKCVFPLVDSIGLNAVELRQLFNKKEGESLILLSKMVREILFHTEKRSIVIPSTKKADESLLFASFVASYRAAKGKLPTFDELIEFAGERRSFYVEKPVATVGLGDTFACAYFLTR
jgi:ADP-dependent phosphofructokinase/glucokinase